MAQTIPEAKQPYEIFSLWVNFVNNMEDDEIIIAANSEIKITNGSTGDDVTADMVVSDSIITVENTKLQFTIKSGTSGEKYKISFRAYISETKKLEEDIILKVKD